MTSWAKNILDLMPRHGKDVPMHGAKATAEWEAEWMDLRRREVAAFERGASALDQIARSRSTETLP